MGSFESHNFRDQLSIDTPEQVDLRFSVAGLGSRFVAMLLDYLLMLAIVVGELLILIAVSAARLTSSSPGVDHFIDHWGMALLIFVNFVLFWGYFALFEAYWNGQTPGKRVMKLRVIKDSGRRITFFESLARNLLRFVDWQPTPFYLVGVVTMMLNKQSKRLGDLAAGTIVVHELAAEQPLLVRPVTSIFPQPAPALRYDPQPASVPAMFAADAVARLTPQDLIVIEAFFARALDLSLDTRAAMAQRIASQLSARMQTPLPEGNPERALESIAYAMRGSGRSFS